MRVLLAEDDDAVAIPLTGLLQHHGLSVVRTGTAAGVLAEDHSSLDVVLLDLGLPDRDGLEVCTRLRQVTDVPIIVVTARGDLASRLQGLDGGADDYLVKPYDVRELLSRIHAVVRRRAAPAASPGAATAAVQVGPLLLDPLTREVTVDGAPVALTRKEFDLLALLAGSPGVVLRREHLVASVWGGGATEGARTLEVHVASLRGKLGRPDLVETVRGVGYRLRGQAGAQRYGQGQAESRVAAAEAGRTAHGEVV
ncbi:MAG: response regulator transcription factor [Actinomycetes bacterium]